MNKKENKQMPLPHNGRRVNNIEILRPYIETEVSVPKENKLDGEKGEKIEPKWGFGYQAELSGNNSTFSPDEE